MVFFGLYNIIWIPIIYIMGLFDLKLSVYNNLFCTKIGYRTHLSKKLSNVESWIWEKLKLIDTLISNSSTVTDPLIPRLIVGAVLLLICLCYWMWETYKRVIKSMELRGAQGCIIAKRWRKWGRNCCDWKMRNYWTFLPRRHQKK